MKKTLILSALFLISGLTVMAQETEVKKAEAKKIRKEVKLEENNGIKTLTVITEDDGKVAKEVYTGAEADQKLKELEDADAGKELSDGQKKVKFEEINGKKLLTIKSIEDGKEKIEQYEGEEAEKKLKELQEVEGKQPQQKKVLKEERKIEKSNM